MRATKKFKVPPPTNVDLGAGTLAGGRGLPDDLSAVQFEKGKLKTNDLPTSGLTQLLAGLSTIELPEIPEQQTPQLEVDLSQPEKLIGNVPILQRMAEHQDPKIRQTAAWALGRSDRLEVANSLLKLLKDQDLSVAIEARYALCWIARMPTGFGHDADPTLKYEDSDLQIDLKPIITEWQTKIHQDWKQWYLEQRPYQIRDDFEDPLQREFRRRK